MLESQKEFATYLRKMASLLNGQPFSYDQTLLEKVMETELVQELAVECIDGQGHPARGHRSGNRAGDRAALFLRTLSAGNKAGRRTRTPAYRRPGYDQPAFQRVFPPASVPQQRSIESPCTAGSGRHAWVRFVVGKPQQGNCLLPTSWRALRCPDQRRGWQHHPIDVAQARRTENLQH